MTFAEFQTELVRWLRPRMRLLATRHPEFVADVIARLVARAPDHYPAPLFENDSDREEFAAEVALEQQSAATSEAGSIWLLLLIQVLLPALIRAVLEWWNASDDHRRQLRDLRDRLAIESLASLDS